MKTYINNFKFCLLAIAAIFLHSCSEDESIPNKVRAETTQGGVLRTIKVNQGTFNFFNTSAKWSVTVEEQDGANGSLMTEVKLYAKHTTGGVTKAEKLIKTFPASLFTTGPNGYPVADLTASLAETLTALGITAGGYTASDKFAMRLELILSDGKTFSSTNAASTITGGVFYSSPFNYSVQFFCPFTDVSSITGNYTVKVDGWEDYGIPGPAKVLHVPADGAYKFRILSDLNPSCANPGDWYILVTVNPADATITDAVTVGYEVYSSSPTATKYTVTKGTGSIGSCTGDINLKATWGPYGTYNFNLVKS